MAKIEKVNDRLPEMDENYVETPLVMSEEEELAARHHFDEIDAQRRLEYEEYDYMEW